MDAEINILETNFEITLEGFATEEEANNIGRFTLEAIRALNNNLNLEISKLKCIVISYNFSEALQKITSTYQHKSPSSYTNSKQGAAVGQLVSKIGNDGLCEEYTLVLSIEFFAELFNDGSFLKLNEEGYRAVIHRIHHELVHVHEKNLLTCLAQNFTVNEYGSALLISATRAWSEYLANYMSSGSAPQETIDLFLENLDTVVNEVSDEIGKLIWDYKCYNTPLSEMYLEVKKRIRLIINSYAYAMGYVHSLNINIKEYDPKLSLTLSNSKIRYQLSELGIAFQNLYGKFNDQHITGFDDYREITIVISEIFKQFGLVLECPDWSSDCELYIHVN
ncbi:hypothetical protein ACWU4V_002708 [Salmonella enterica subsp. enterica serovar Chester]|uniref:Uncharacterized protein n=5 Tax=Salmonella enterica TaxID=28901 RepID=A0A601WEN0_SALET|nr:hypothetical protein [Salmonella enterica]EAA3623732.1 hypothetical protein [Salmonella enterica subsp. enterica serovar Typhimurium]EAA7832813.1 hypothetical protein [Salmonella enterica subsp. enterica serovar Give]EBE0949422.1 hypothetical protein [Salmonella enterica subsp. enterica serovar 4,[5],12:i:-]EBG3489306.1 hypothetical protein [Salmonella enterica subsp. enterica]EBS0338968.1 hypothetical protein [Salmonella enterica subsp. enterica serovar Ituri]EBW5243164.1 hypothetical pro